MQLSQSNRPTNSNTFYYHRHYPHHQDPSPCFSSTTTSQQPFAEQLNNSNSPPAWRARNATMTTTTTVIDPSGAVSYCLDRGNGQFTRLIPADMLPPLSDIPPRETKADGMYVLPSLVMEPEFMKRPIRIKVCPTSISLFYKR